MAGSLKDQLGLQRKTADPSAQTERVPSEQDDSLATDEEVCFVPADEEAVAALPRKQNHSKAPHSSST